MSDHDPLAEALSVERGWHGRQTTIVQRATEEHAKHVAHEEARHGDR